MDLWIIEAAPKTRQTLLRLPPFTNFRAGPVVQTRSFVFTLVSSVSFFLISCRFYILRSFFVTRSPNIWYIARISIFCDHAQILFKNAWNLILIFTRMNAEKLNRLAQQVRTGGAGSVRRKKKVVRKTQAGDDKKLLATLKRLGVNNITGIEEVNLFKEDGSVIHFANPKGKISFIIILNLSSSSRSSI